MAYLLLNTVTPRGSTATVHRVHGIRVAYAEPTAPDDNAGIDRVIVTVNSFADAENQLPVWQQDHTMPMIAFEQGSYPANVLSWLRGTGGPLNGAEEADDLSSLAGLKAMRRAAVLTLRDEAIHAGVVTPAGRVDSDETSIRNIMGSYQAAVLSLVSQAPFAVSWRLSDNSVVALDAMGMVGLGNAVLAHVQACYETSWALKAAIEDAATIEDLNAIMLTGFEQAVV